MLDERLLNPFGTDPKSELPIVPQDIPLWTEFCFFHCYDAVSQTGLSLHAGREPYDSRMWRATIGVYVPGGEELLVAKYTGRDGHARGAGAGPVKVSCVEPFRLWTLEFDGAMQSTSRVDNMAKAHEDSPSEPVRFFLYFEGAAPMWDLREHMKGQTWGAEHWEQICRVTGEISFRGKTYPINGSGARDHSCGPRDYGPLLADFWINMLFENGAALQVQTIRHEGSSTDIRNGYLFRNDGSPLEVIEVVEGPVVNSVDTPKSSICRDPLMDESLRKFRLVIKTAKGLETIDGELVHSVATSLMAPNDVLLGTTFGQLDKGQPRALQLTESAAIYSWNGVKGVGNRERIARISTLK